MNIDFKYGRVGLIATVRRMPPLLLVRSPNFESWNITDWRNELLAMVVFLIDV